MRVRKNFIGRGVLAIIATVILLTMVVKANGDIKAYIRLSSYQSRLNVREEPTTESRVLGKLKPGDIVNIVGESGDFYKIKFADGNSAYIYKDYVVIPKGKNRELVAAAVVTSASSDDRNYNMYLACKKINGLVLQPGEKFDWYGSNGVGRAEQENGYKKATVIQGGQYVEGYGGGVCQVSTALYNAIYDLGIEPDELHHHSISSSYIEEGMDATVAYPYKNFVFTNSKTYALEIEAFQEYGQVTVLIKK